MCTFHRQIHLCRHLCDISKNESELPTVSQKSCLFVFYQTRAPVWIFRIQSAAPTSQKASTCERVALHEYIKQTWTDIMLSFWDKVNKSRIFSPPNLEVYRAGWLDKSGLHSLLDCNTRVTPYTELNTLHWRWVRVLSPPPEKAQHPSSWAHTLRDPHHKPRADALPSRWSSSSGSSVGAVHGFPLSPPPTFFTFFFNGVTFYVEYFSISSR